MTTGLVVGMSLEEAGRAVAKKAVDAMEAGGGDVGIWSEVGHQSVLVGIARRGKATSTTLIPRSEFDGRKLFELLGLR